MLCNWQFANKQLPLGQRDVQDNRKCLQDIKNIKLFSWEEGLLEIRPNQCKGWQLYLTENILQDFLPP